MKKKLDIVGRTYQNNIRKNVLRQQKGASRGFINAYDSRSEDSEQDLSQIQAQRQKQQPIKRIQNKKSYEINSRQLAQKTVQSKMQNQKKNKQRTYSGEKKSNQLLHKNEIEYKNLEKLDRLQNKLIGLNKKLNIIICTFLIIISAVLVIHYQLHMNRAQDESQQQIILNFKQKNQQIIKTKFKTLDVSNQPINRDDSKIQQDIMQKKSNNQQNKKIIQNKIQEISIQKTNEEKIVQNSQYIKSKRNIVIKPKDLKNSVTKSIYSKSLSLQDFSNDEVYLSAPQQIKQIFDQMIKRPSNKITRPHSIFMPTQKAYFAYNLFKNPQNQRFLKAQYYYYDTKYKISKFNNELPLCIVAPGRNIIKTEKYKRFIDSIQRQNYSNYILVYIDDVSDDNSTLSLENYVKQSNGLLSQLKNQNKIHQGSFIVNKQPFQGQYDQRRLFIVQNKQRVFALANRNKGIRNFCPDQSIILDIDADDSLIGKQAFKFVNAIYHDESVWMFNSVFIYDKNSYRQVTTGPQDGVPEQVLNQNSYRTSMLWQTSQLRTFKAKLFNKISQDDFRNEKGQIYQWASDVFIQQPLVQLSGPLHYKHLYEIVYYYDWDFDRTTVHKRRHFKFIALMQTPYKPLKSLEDKAQKLQNYQVPQSIRKQFEDNRIEAQIQAKKYRRQQNYLTN